ncbi:MAG TPA: outer membrane protein assembly factor BamD [Hyphomicrobiaceae bacterium]|nr:outer membrane protein assembly factor BamD [Hyphomicrobiaceae bacterium]
MPLETLLSATTPGAAGVAGARQVGRAVAVIVLAGFVLGGCASSDSAQKALNPDPPDKMYSSADRSLEKGNWNEAARKFEELDRDHPYAQEARRAMVMAAFAHYKAGKFPEAIATAQRYTTVHPGTKEAALAHHIIASAHFDEIRDPSRDQTSTRKALAELKTLRQRYPDSPYTKQADNRIRIAEDILAASEMNVGRYYLKQNNLIAGINRFKTVVAEYQTTAHVEEALYRLVEANIALGILPEAQAAGAVLGHNFPGSSWYKDAHALLKTNGVAPQANGGWFANVIKPQQARQPEVAPQPVPQGLPRPEELPAPRFPVPKGSDIPTASTTKPKQMGLGMSQSAAGAVAQ